MTIGWLNKNSKKGISISFLVETSRNISGSQAILKLKLCEILLKLTNYVTHGNIIW